MKRLLVVFFVFSLSNCFAQIAPSDLLDRGMYSFNALVSTPFGRYNKQLINDFTSNQAAGLSFFYLRNTRYNKTMSNKVFLGGDIGFNGKSQSKFKTMPTSGDFYMNHREWWFNFMMRYKPIIYATKFSPFFDIFAGPKIFASRLMERVSSEDTQKIQSFNTNALNYGLTAGIGYKLNTSKYSPKYIETSISYNGTNSVKIIDRATFGLDRNFTIISSQKVVNPQNVIFKIGLTSYL